MGPRADHACIDLSLGTAAACLCGTVQGVNERDSKSGRNGRSRRHFVCLAVALVGMFGCASSGTTRSSLAAEAAAQLHMPGSSEITSGGHDEEHTPEGVLAAITWREYGVDASWEEIVAFFDRKLTGQGWEAGGGSSGIRSSSEHAVEAWHRGDRILRLGHLRDSPDPGAASFRTWYEVALIGHGVPTD